jgi:gamma-glutamyltranspeptidase / glutathione hydrolase
VPQPRPFMTRPDLRGTFGMVASTHWLASAAGMAVLERGGNAFDAAVAAGFTLQVVEPHLNGPGGDMPALVYHSDGRRVHVVCGQGPVPEAATPDAFRRLGLDMVPGSGLLPACVPGAFGAWLLMLREFGTWRLRDVLEFAIGYAEQGYPLVPQIVDTIAGVADLFAGEWPESARVYLPDGRLPEPGTLHRNPDLAATYRRVLREAEARGGGREAEIEAARRAWYEGFVAEAVDGFFSSAEVMDVTGVRNPGLLRGSDMARWQATLEAPRSFDYGRWQVFKTGPWGQGPVFLQQLALLAGFDLGSLDPTGPDFIHLVVECTKLAMADREAWYGDPAFVDDVVDDLVDPAYAAERRTLVGERASLEMRPGRPGGREPRLPQPGEPPIDDDQAGLGDPTLQLRGAVRGDTCHLDVIDRWGNMVSATPSGGWLQSSPVVPGLGFCMGTRAQIVTLEEGLPNTIAPGKRPRTTLSPSMAFRDGEPHLAFGTPGADQQDQWTLTFFTRLAATGWDLQRLIDLPMFHTNSFYRSFYPHHWYPGQVVVEERIAPGVISELERRGHQVQVVPGWSLGRISAVARDAGGLLRAGANPRGMQGYAVGR